MKNMNKSSDKGPAPSQQRLTAGNPAGDKGYRPHWAAAVMLAAVASILLAGAWHFKEGESSFRVGSPAMKTYYAHSRMRIVDESATRALREQRMSDIGGVLVKDRKFPKRSGASSPPWKRGIMPPFSRFPVQDNGKPSRGLGRRIIGVASRVALSYQDSSGERNFRLTSCGGALRPRPFHTEQNLLSKSWTTSGKSPGRGPRSDPGGEIPRGFRGRTRRKGVVGGGHHRQGGRGDLARGRPRSSGAGVPRGLLPLEDPGLHRDGGPFLGFLDGLVL